SGECRCAWDGSDRACPLVGALISGAAVRTVGGRPGADQSGPGAEAEDRPARCRPHSEVDGGGSLSAGVGPECGESGSASTALASASGGADADAGHESVAGDSR